MRANGGLAGDMAAGAAAGLVAAFVMEGFQQIWATVAGAATPKPAGGHDPEPATVRAADRIAQASAGKDIPKRYRTLAGTAMHYGLGAALGGAYGAASALTPAMTAGNGSAFGTACWLALDEGVLPAAGLAKPWRGTPGGVHLFAFVSHLIFGLSLDRALRRLRPAPTS